jgi:hypothetical protein
MRTFCLVLSVAAYLNLLFLIWTLASLASCDASDGCLGFAFYFWVGLASGIGLLITGILTGILARERRVETGTLTLSMSVLAIAITGVLIAAWLTRPS